MNLRAYSTRLAIQCALFNFIVSGVWADGTKPTISPSGEEVYVLVSATAFELTLDDDGEAPEPSESASCPPWVKDGVCRYNWSNGTLDAGSTEVDVSAGGNKGEFTVQGVGQMWKDGNDNVGGPTETPASDPVTIHAVEVKFEHGSYSVDDGESVDINIVIDQAYQDKVANGVLTIAPSSGSPTTLSPGGLSVVERQASDYEWKIPHAYWVDVGCEINSSYELTFTFDLDGVSQEISATLTVVGLKAGGDNNYIGGECIYNQLSVAGSPVSSTGYNGTIKKMVTSITGVGSLNRRVGATPRVFNHSDSQFFGKILAEENEHEQQMEGARSADLDPSAGFFVASEFYNTVSLLKGYSSAWTGTFAPSGAALSQLTLEAEADLIIQYQHEADIYQQDQTYSVNAAVNTKRNAMEQAAKAVAGAVYLLTYACRY